MKRGGGGLSSNRSDRDFSFALKGGSGEILCFASGEGSTGSGRVGNWGVAHQTGTVYASDLRRGKQICCLNAESTLCHSENEKLAFGWFVLRMSGR